MNPLARLPESSPYHFAKPNFTRTDSETGLTSECDTLKEYSTDQVPVQKKHKWLLLAIFSTAAYLDVAARSSVIVFTDTISRDLEIEYEASTWILNSYSVTFGAFLLLWGRVSDLYSARPVFVAGFLVSGLLSILISVSPNQYVFFVLRAFFGVATASTIPSAFRLIVSVFDPAELPIALSVFAMASAVANASGLILGGAFGYIQLGGQMADWRWFCRFWAAVAAPAALLAYLVVPRTSQPLIKPLHRFKKLDLPGCLLVLSSLVLLASALTLGAAKGWTTPTFYVPFALCWPLGIGFFVWESRLPEGYALIPASLWRYPNLKVAMFVTLNVYAWVGVIQLCLVERYELVYHYNIMRSAIRMLPQGLAAICASVVMATVFKRVKNFRWLLSIGWTLAGGAYVLMIYGEEQIGTHYWRYYLPAFIVGSSAVVACYLALNITLMSTVPESMAGVAGALFQTCLQIGVFLGFAIQAGLLTYREGGVATMANVQASFWLQFGWCILNALLVAIFFRYTQKEPADTQAETWVCEDLATDQRIAYEQYCSKQTGNDGRVC